MRRTENIIIKHDDNDVLTIDVSTNRNRDARMLIDYDDWVNICLSGKYGRWYAIFSGRNVYAQANLKGGAGSVQIHKIIAPKYRLVDHKNRNDRDNRFDNLRECTRGQNGINADPKSNNTSGVTGVWWHKEIKRWRAEIKVDRKKICIGSFKEKEDAIVARKEAEKKYGMRIYQGGAIPDRSVRIVNTPGWDVEACAGTHLNNTKDTGKIVIVSTERIQDGVDRITLKAGPAGQEYLNNAKSIASSIISTLKDNDIKFSGKFNLNMKDEFRVISDLRKSAGIFIVFHKIEIFKS